MDKKVIELLEKEFDKKDIKQRKGSFGKMLDYLEGHVVIRRLNEAFGHDWSFHIVNHVVQEDSVVVHVRIDHNGIQKDGYGGRSFTKVKDSNKYVDIGNDFKIATTDGLKVAARLFGVGLHLYDAGSSSPGKPEEPKVDPNSPATTTQKTAIKNLMEIKKVDREKFLAENKVKDPAKVTIGQAKDLILKLNSL